MLFTTHLHTYGILAGWYFLSQDPGYPAASFDSRCTLDDTKNEHIYLREDHWRVVREIAVFSIVLLRNTGGAPSLKKPRRIAVIGSDAAPLARP